MTSRQIFLLAIWIGLIAGILEAGIGLALQAAGWPLRILVEILWMAPVINLALFTAIGLVLAILHRFPWPVDWPRMALIILFGLMTFGLVQASDVMRPWAAVLVALGIAMTIARRPQAAHRSAALAHRTIGRVVGVAAMCCVIGFAWAPLRERRLIAALPSAKAGLPNVLVVTLDTLRADHVSGYGYARQTTPRLDALARRGVLFEHAFANSSWTLPSHASMLTGRLPHEHGADWLTPLSGSVPMLPEALAQRGYATGAFAANTSFVSPEWGVGRGFSRFDVYGSSWADTVVRTAHGRRLALNVLPRLGYYDIPGRKSASTVNDEFMSWVEGASGRPFFALLNYLDVHDPYVTVEPYHTRYSADAARGDLINFQFQPHAFRRQPALTAAQVQAEIDAYDGCLAYLDTELGRLFDGLAARGLDRNTIVIVTSDHGEAFGNHDLFGHGNSVYLETLHVPLIVVYPPAIPAGMRVADVVGLDRIPATVIDLLADRATSDFPGESLTPLWRTPEAPGAPSAVVSEVTHVRGGPAAYPTSRSTLTSLITPEWHLIAAADGSVQLFAWRRDAREQTDLADSTPGQAALPQLREMLRQMRDRPGTK